MEVLEEWDHFMQNICGYIARVIVRVGGKRGVAKIWLGDVTAQRVTSLKTEKNPGSVNLCKPFAFCVTCVCKRNPSWITTKRNRLRVQLFLTLLCTKTRHICRR